MALLMFPFFISCGNLLDISAMFADVSLDHKLVSFRNSFLDSFRNTVAVGANRIAKNVAIAVPLKHSSKFRRSLEMPLINCKVRLKLK